MTHDSWLIDSFDSLILYTRKTRLIFPCINGPNITTHRTKMESYLKDTTEVTSVPIHVPPQTISNKRLPL